MVPSSSYMSGSARSRREFESSRFLTIQRSPALPPELRRRRELLLGRHTSRLSSRRGARDVVGATRSRVGAPSSASGARTPPA
uniref:Uncharacterized protein n=1 Tax=Setaria viridis TaxID=4556 RepID=A0A4U6UTK8_SETVI|nr:hypothetical protein SEVIR_5G363150v2 [Setaria viridis]